MNDGVASDAAFGWAPPRMVGPERISVTVAATAQALVRPYLRALTEIGAASILVSTGVTLDGEGTVRATWSYEDSEVPDFDQLVQAAQAL